MANYKDIIASTIGNLVGKVKEVADKDTVRDIYEQGANKAKAVGRIAKLNLEIAGQNEDLKRLYTELGKLYFEQAKDAPEGYFAPLFAQIADMQESIQAKSAEIECLKSGDCCGGDDIEVEVVDFEEKDCCTAEDFCEKVEDAVECCCDKAEEVCECCCDKVEEVIDAVEDKVEEKLGE